MYSTFVLVCLATLVECQYDPSIETAKAGYEEAEQQIGPQVIPSHYGTGKEQLKYVDERQNVDVFEEFDQVFDLFREYVKNNNYGQTEKDREYAGKLDEIHSDWKQSIEGAPAGVQQDFASTLTNIFSVLTSQSTINLFYSLVDLWDTFSSVFFGGARDTPVGVVKPDWQIDFENAIRDQQIHQRRARIMRHRRQPRSTDNNELESSDMDALPFARQTTKRAATTRRTTTKKPQATTRKAQAGRTTKKAASQSAQQLVEQEQSVDVDNGIHETYIKAPRIINVFVDDDQPAELIAQAVAAQYFEFEKNDPNP